MSQSQKRQPMQQKLREVWEGYTELILATPIGLLFAFFAYIVVTPDVAHQMAQEALKLAIGVDASMLGLVLASLAVVTAVARPEFIRWLKEQQLYDTLRRPFWYTSIMWAVHLAFSAIAFVASYGISASRPIFVCLVTIYGFGFSYALAASVGLVVFVFQMSERQAEFDMLEAQRR